MHIPSTVRRTTLLGLAFAAAACGDAATAPAVAEPAAAEIAAPALGRAAAGPETYTLELDPSYTGYYMMGQNWVWMPTNAVCDPSSASYGVTEWDKPCQPLTTRITVTARLSVVNGETTVRFSPDLRFVPAPADQRDRWVYLGLKAQGKLEPKLSYAILYQATGSTTWIDESTTDATLRAFRTTGNTVARRLKHFSGYQVGVGAYEEQPDPTTGPQ